MCLAPYPVEVYLTPLPYVVAFLSLSNPTGGSTDDPPDAWIDRLAPARRVVDRVVIAFDDAGFLAELERWDAQHFWPVLLWDPALTPIFLEAFEPEEVVFARYGNDGAELSRGLRAVAGAWGAEVAGDPAASDLLAILRERERPPNGAVLVDPASPEWLGGLALAAGACTCHSACPTPRTKARSCGPP